MNQHEEAYIMLLQSQLEPGNDNNVFEIFSQFMGQEFSQVTQKLKRCLDLIEISIKIEALYVLTILLESKNKPAIAYKARTHEKFYPMLRNMIDENMFTDVENRPMYNDVLECFDQDSKFYEEYTNSVKTFEQQFLRIIQSLCDLNFNKYWFFTDEDCEKLSKLNENYKRKNNSMLDRRLNEIRVKSNKFKVFLRSDYFFFDL